MGGDGTAEGARVRAAAVAGTAVFLLAVAWLIARRTALTMDERHTLLVAQAIAGGEPVSFYVGSVTRYEGGSWLIAWPVALLVRLGAYGTAATSWVAAAIAGTAVAAGSLWLGRHRGPSAALLLGPVCAAAFPEGMHYSYRAWGSICEALVMLPVLALLHDRWTVRGRGSGGASLLGLGLAFALVLSYFHFITVAALVLVEATAGGRSWRERAGSVVTIVGVAAGAFLAWVALANPHPAEAWVVRDGRTLGSTVLDLLLPRLDLVLRHLPGAVLGEITPATPVRWIASGGIVAASVAAGVTVWRDGGPARRVVVFALLFLPALGVGHALLDPPEVYRYYLPLLAAMAAMLAAAGPLHAGVAIVCGAAFWLPSGLAMPYQNPAFTVLELGSNAMHRYAEDPHVKFKLLRPYIPEWHRRWFAFGYGVDSGRRCSPTRSAGGAVQGALGALQPADIWVDFWDDPAAPEERADYLFGLGVGFAADGTLDRWEREVVEAAGPVRGDILLGLGAAIGRSLTEDGVDAGSAVGRAILAGVAPGDVKVVGEGIARTAAAGRPEGADLGFAAGSPERDALEAGLGAEVDRARRAMVRVPTIPTPHPPPS